MVIGYILSFICGVFALGLAQFFLIWCFFTRSRRAKHSQTAAGPSFSLVADPNAPSRITIEGELWVASVSPLQIDCINKSSGVKVSKERKQKKDIEQITVLLNYAKLQDRNLLLTSTDGTSASIYLEGCSVVAVSSSTSPSRKWARKYPIKLEHASRALLGTTVCLLYFKTGWEKETWCEALRAAAKKDYGPEDWYSKIKAEFGEYVSELRNSYPEVFKTGFNGRRTQKESAPCTKKSISWRRLLKKKKGEGAKTKAVTVQTEDRPEEDTMTTSSSFHDFENMSDTNQSDTNPEASAGGGKRFFENAGAEMEFHVPKQLDGGVCSLNVMLSRLFFDLHHSSDFITVVHNRIQTLLSRIPTPGYISPITCSSIDIGKSCPFVHSLRPLPLSDDVFGVEADIEYNGGAVLTLETRLDMRESRAGDQKSQTSSAAAATTDIINKSLETVEDDLEVAGDGMQDQNSGSSNKRKRWNQLKTFLSSVADQVSQVPLTLSMRVVSLKGTLQLRIKASPSDRIWYSFSSMPALELLPEPSVGDHKITTGPLLSYIAERIQILVYETMVYPNSEDIHIPWMVSDERNWAHHTAAPFPQVLTEPKLPEKPKESSFKAEQEAGESVTVEGGIISELERPLLEKRNGTEDRQQHKQQHQHQQPQEQLQQPQHQQPERSTEFNDDAGEPSNASIEYQGSEGETSFRGSGEDSKKRKGTRREKMLNLGKMFEEKTRQFAERMRERFDKD